MPKLLMEEFDAEESVTGTWEVDMNGSIRHRDSGMRISPDEGIQVDGRAYALSPQDIEMDDGTIGSGAGGVVSVGVHKPTGTRVAVKTVKVDSKTKREQMLSEIKGLISAEGCPYLVQWYAGFVAKDTGLVNVCIEFMDRGSLADLKRRLGGGSVPPEHLAYVAASVIRGLAHLEERRVLHRDVKPENILHAADGQVKLTDFGISKDVNTSVGMTFIGTANYMAPERVSGKEYSFPSDIWSAGMVIYELAMGTYPFTTSNFLELYEHLTAKPEPRLDAAAYPPALCSFIEDSLSRDELARPDALTLNAHEFIADQGDDQMKAMSAWVQTLDASR